jgi:MFS family permease
MSKRFIYLTRPVLVLSFVSFFTDIASEMLYPVMPVYLESIGFSILLIGILEGLAETTAGIGKGYFGNLSDATGRRLPFVQMGYLLSAIAKPLLAVSALPAWVFGVRTAERIGKGLRTGARDAMLSDLGGEQHKGKVFGFHRSMDTLGAVAGPLIALVFLRLYPAQYTSLFLLAAIPGAISIILLFSMKEKRTSGLSSRPGLFSFLKYYRKGSKQFRHSLNGLILFALFNSSDVLLLLKMKETGMDDAGIITVYIFYNLVFAVFSFPTGILADRLGIRKTLLLGLGLYVLVYSGFAVNDQNRVYWLLFFLYGLYAAATDGLSKAWISQLVPGSETGTAIGLYTGLAGIAAFVASSMAGWIWLVAGAGLAFGLTAFAAALALLYLLATTNDDVYGKEVRST